VIIHRLRNLDEIRAIEARNINRYISINVTMSARPRNKEIHCGIAALGELAVSARITKYKHAMTISAGTIRQSWGYA
jgi:hypothetical protein